MAKTFFSPGRKRLPERGERRKGVRRASAFARGAWRGLLLHGVGAVAIVVGASFAQADSLRTAQPVLAVGAKLSILSPEASLKFGDLADASPCLPCSPPRPALELRRRTTPCSLS